MESLQSPRGTRDILPEQAKVWQQVKAVATDIGNRMGYQPITIPTYEDVRLFQRAIGEGTDIRDKELFLVRGVQTENGAEQYALRPEGTASIVRAYIEHGMHTLPQPVKLFSIIQNFRYDRPQKGRYREHVQFDIEYFGDTGPFADAWVIYTTWQFLQKLGLSNIELKLNSLGTPEDRIQYCQALTNYYTPIIDGLSTDAQKRLAGNPLRLLDSKERADIEARESAPRLVSYLSDDSAQHFIRVQEYLTAWNIPFVLDPFLVRGLDYYSHTAFEWTVKSQEGQQDSLGGGGRYDGLVTQLGGKPTGAVGAGLGMDRIIEELERQGITLSQPSQPIGFFVVAADDTGLAASPAIIDTLLGAGYQVECNFSKESLSAQLKAASKTPNPYTIIVGGEELANASVILKNMDTGNQEVVALTELIFHCENL